MKKISVIIPTFNREKILRNTILCLLNQKDINVDDYEIVIVDSGTDSTDIFIKYIQGKININLIYKKIEKSRNRSFIRNEGAKLARNEILCFLDSDRRYIESF